MGGRRAFQECWDCLIAGCVLVIAWEIVWSVVIVLVIVWEIDFPEVIAFGVHIEIAIDTFLRGDRFGDCVC